MNVERDRKSHRLAWSSAIAVLVVAFGAPIAGAAGIEVPQVTQVPLPVEQPPLPGLPELPEVPQVPLPEVEPPLPVPDVTTVPVPVEELTDDVGEVVDGATDVVDDVTGGDTGDVVDDVVDDVTGGAGDVVDEVTDPEGPVGGVVDDVTDPDGPVGGVVDDVTGEAGNNAGKVVDSVVDKVGGVLDDVAGGLPGSPDAPGIPKPKVPGLDPVTETGTDPGGAGPTRTPEEAAALGERIAATVPADGFAANVLAASETAAASAPPTRDVPEPSLVQQIAQSISDVAQRIAFPLLLAAAVGAFVVAQNRVDRKDPKLALASLDADEDLLGFE
ncbi:MAG: hypothetical protein M3279_09545 [Actinomycetota bacterium]|nr:hypothetical protein [Actinomycetota bacterium]